MKYVLIIYILTNAGVSSEQVPMKNAELCEIAAAVVLDTKTRSGYRAAEAFCLEVK